MSGVRAGRVPKRLRAHRMKSRSGKKTYLTPVLPEEVDRVLRMMAIMQDRNSEEVPREFLETGRTGRRNAMPDILHPQGAEMTTADLPSRLQQLVTTDPEHPQPSTSKNDLEVSKDDQTNKNNTCS